MKSEYDIPVPSEDEVESYLFTNGWTMAREAPGIWCLRDLAYEEVDRDRSQHDLISRHHLKIAEHHAPEANGNWKTSFGDVG